MLQSVWESASDALISPHRHKKIELVLARGKTGTLVPQDAEGRKPMAEPQDAEDRKPMADSFLWSVELPALVKMPGRKGIQFLTYIETYRCDHLMRDFRDRAENLVLVGGIGFGDAKFEWTKVGFLACRELKDF